MFGSFSGGPGGGGPGPGSSGGPMGGPSPGGFGHGPGGFGFGFGAGFGPGFSFRSATRSHYGMSDPGEDSRSSSAPTDYDPGALPPPPRGFFAKIVDFFRTLPGCS